MPDPAPPRPRLARPLFLLGMMGAGKSRVGRELADMSGSVFIDLDRRVELMFGTSVPRLFELGESYFRACERTALVSLLAEPGFARAAAVVATGGGVVLDPANVAAMSEVGPRIYLEVPVETLVARLSSPSERRSRPLLGDREQLARRLQELLHERESLYRAAGLSVAADAEPAALASEILRQLV